MTLQAISWIVVGFNLALVALNSYHMYRLTRERHRLERIRLSMEQTSEDFTRRIMAGHIRVTADDGTAGHLVVRPDGDGLRISVEPDDDTRQVH